MRENVWLIVSYVVQQGPTVAVNKNFTFRFY